MIYISSDFYLHLEDSEPDLKYPRIGYLNYGDSVVVSSTASGYRAEGVLNNYTYERWCASSYPATIAIELDSIREINYIGIGAHTLAGFAVKAEYSLNGVDYTDITEFIQANNNAIMILFAKVEALYVRLTITGVGTAEIGVVFVGETLVMQRGIYGGHTPALLANTTEITHHLSEAGEFIGTTVVRKGYSTQYNFSNLTAEWIRDYFQDFMESARTNPFFMAWKPDTFLDEVFYGWCPSDIKPVNSGKRDFMSVNFDVRGYHEL
jgi:hypothetical protein